MRIRKAAKKDIKEIAKLMIEEFSKPPFKEKTTINSVIKSLNFYFKIGKAFVAVEDKKSLELWFSKLSNGGKVLLFS